jgi:hypothetical protein
MAALDPPVRVGNLSAPVGPATAIVALDRRLTPGALGVGQEVGARVLADRAGGRFLALIDGRQVELVLPPGGRAGDTLRLTVIADQPRLVLSAQQGGRAGTTSAGGTGSTAALPDARMNYDAVAPGGPSDGVSVSAEGRALARVVADIASASVARRDVAAAPQVGRSLQPLVSAPAGSRTELVGQLAGVLAATFADSGLFYESHQAQWVAGERSLDTLRQEPQGRLPPLPAAETSPGRAAAHDSTEGQRPLSTGPREAPPAAGPAPGGTLSGVVDPAATILVQQQLAVLDGGSAAWSGMVLPGVPVRIAVQERPARSAEEPDEQGAAMSEWSTTVSVDLPRLGQVDARLLLRGDRLLLSVAAEAGGRAEAIAADRRQLLDALGAAGLKVDALQVEPR